MLELVIMVYCNVTTHYAGTYKYGVLESENTLGWYWNMVSRYAGTCNYGVL